MFSSHTFVEYFPAELRVILMNFVVTGVYALLLNSNPGEFCPIQSWAKVWVVVLIISNAKKSPDNFVLVYMGPRLSHLTPWSSNLTTIASMVGGTNKQFEVAIYLDLPQFTLIYLNQPWFYSIYIDWHQFTLIFLNLHWFTPNSHWITSIYLDDAAHMHKVRLKDLDTPKGNDLPRRKKISFK